jgi:predicted nucleic acid-binding protein
MSAEPVVYLDSSALVKLVVREPESKALIHHLRSRPTRVSCGLARVEVLRAVRPHGPASVTRAQRLLERVGLLRLDDDLLDSAGAMEGPTLRSLDAIHLAAAAALGDALIEFITYDVRMSQAATQLGLAVAAPD